jgi:uncharacterized membrane protein YozB (DUF420 family)
MTARSNENRVFFLAHLLLLSIVLVGFGRTFYLRALFIARPLPVVLVLHGLALTLWYALVVLQGWLVLAGRRNWHAKLAWIAIPIVACVIVTGIQANMRIALEITSARDPENMFVWGNFMTLLSFVILVVAGVVQRRTREAHRRLMFFASLAIIGPAFARFAFWPAVGLGVVAAPIFAMGGMLLLVALAIVYDLIAGRRVQRATLIGVAGVIVPLIVGTALALSGLGFALLH